jgi:hypothetical protein
VLAGAGVIIATDTFVSSLSGEAHASAIAASVASIFGALMLFGMGSLVLKLFQIEAHLRPKDSPTAQTTVKTV